MKTKKISGTGSRCNKHNVNRRTSRHRPKQWMGLSRSQKRRAVRNQRVSNRFHVLGVDTRGVSVNPATLAATTPVPPPAPKGLWERMKSAFRRNDTRGR